MSQSVGQTKTIPTEGTESVPGGRDQEFTVIVGGPVTLLSAGHDPEVLSEIPVIRSTEDKGNQRLFAETEAIVRVEYIERTWDEARDHADKLAKKSKPKGKKGGE
jgi:hypothetical protein